MKVTRGLICERYERNEYRPAIRVDQEIVLVGIRLDTMRNAIEETNELEVYYWGVAR